MHSMLKEFYDFIAKRINRYFLEISAEGALQKGESFYLKLDDLDTVQKVADAIKDLATKGDNCGEYEYQCMDGSVYRTFTLKVIDNEIIIAAQINNMTNDFLCATLRNAANVVGKPLLMISSNPIDSAKSGSVDMAANGMPFYADNLMKEIRKMAEENTQLSTLEKRILDFELKRRDSDVFSDKTSLYEYKDLLSIMSSGSIKKENYPGFRLFSVEGKTDYQNEGKTQIDKKIKENHELFEKIDRSIRFGNLEADLTEEFEEGFLTRIEKCRKDDPEHWSIFFTYAEMLAAMEKKQVKKDNPLNIDLKDITVYGDMPLNALPIDEKVLIRNEGSMKTKKRTRSVIVFNADKYPEIHMRLECNARIMNNDISSDDASYVRDGKSLVFCFTREDVSFHKIEIKDAVNNITYVFKVCIIDIFPEYLNSIKRNFVVDYKKTKKKCKVKLIGVGTDLVFNSNGATNVSEKLNDNTRYECKYDERLHLYTTEEELSDFGSGICIEINFSGIVLPFILFPDEVKSIEMVGRKIFREKFSVEKSFQIEEDGDHFYRGSQEYHAKSNLLEELRIEKKIIHERILHGKCKQIHGTDDLKIDTEELVLPLSLKQAYYNLLQAYKQNNTIPTLAYMSGKLKSAVEFFLQEFNLLYESLEEGSYLSQEQENGLLLGTLLVGKNDEELLLHHFIH